MLFSSWSLLFKPKYQYKYSWQKKVLLDLRGQKVINGAQKMTKKKSLALQICVKLTFKQKPSLAQLELTHKWGVHHKMNEW